MRAKVIAILRGTTAFLRWLFSAEHLPAQFTDTLVASSRRGSFAGWLFAGDELSAVSYSPAGAKRRPSWLRWVLSPEQLPIASAKPNAPAVRPNSLWGWLLGGEELRECNLREKPEAPRVSFLRWLLSPDVCHRFEEPPRRQSEGFWRWVLSPETCPRVEEPPRLRPKGFWHWVVSPGRL